MDNNYIVYKHNYKYKLVEPYSVKTDIKGFNAETDYISLKPDGTLSIKAGYAWDGPSGPTVDTKNFMRGSLVHDAFYQLMRQELIPTNELKEPVDRYLRELCMIDGMSKLRSWWIYQGLKMSGNTAFDPHLARAGNLMKAGGDTPGERIASMDYFTLLITLAGIFLSLWVLISLTSTLFAIAADLFSIIEISQAYAATGENSSSLRENKNIIYYVFIVCIVIAFFWTLFVMLSSKSEKTIGRANDLNKMLIGFILASSDKFLSIGN